MLAAQTGLNVQDVVHWEGIVIDQQRQQHSSIRYTIEYRKVSQWALADWRLAVTIRLQYREIRRLSARADTK